MSRRSRRALGRSFALRHSSSRPHVPRFRAPKPRVLTSLVVAISTAFTLSGCGLLSGSQGAQDSGGNGELEKSTITIGALPAPSQTPLAVAEEKGFLAEEGLQVKTKPTPSGPKGLNALISGDVDMSFGSYTPFVKANATGTADIKIVNESMVSQPNFQALITTPNSRVQKPEDVPGKTIAVSGRGAITDLATKSALQDKGIDPNSPKLTEMGFPQMLPALKNGDIDGAVVSEPYITPAAKQMGARIVLDDFTGSTQDFPVAGAATTGKFAQENPKTVAAFQRAMQKAQNYAQQHPSEVNALLPKFAKVPPDLAPLVQLGTIPTTMDAARLQRVSSLMYRFHQIPHEVDVSKMLLQPPQN